MKRLLFILICILILPVTIYSQSSKKERLEKEIAILDKQIKANNKESENTLNLLSLTQKKIASRKKLVAESEKEIRQLNDKIYLKQKEINRLQNRLDTLTLYYHKLVKNAYKNRDSRVWYMYILSADNLNQAVKRFAYLRSLSTQMKIQANKLKATKEELMSQKAQLGALKSEALNKKKDLDKELNSLQKEEASSKKIIDDLKKNKSKYQKQLAEKKRQVEALNREMKKAVQAVRRKSSGPVNVKLSGEFAANKGKLPWPVEGVLVETFGEHYHPVYKSVKLPFNNGIGIATSPGSTVRAVFEGEVRQVIVMPGYNKCVLVQHGDYFTFYCKLSSVSVKSGDKVKLGQAIGKVDTIAGETQLHFQLWKGRDPQDPDKWLK